MFKNAGNPLAAKDLIAPISSREYECIRKLVYDKSRINLGSNKKELVMGRLSKRLRKLNLPSYKVYCRFINSPAGEDELVDLIDSISTNHTYFLREIEHFNFLTDHVLPEMCGENGSARKKPFRVWSAACSSGEESYTIALLLAEKLKPVPNQRWSILCTDISTKMLEKAAAGIFTADHIDKIPKYWRTRYFQKGRKESEGKFRIIPDIRDQMVFRPVNLLQSTYPWKVSFEVIFCRNVMIYLDRPTQQELVDKLTAFLVPGGYLMIGHSESLTGVKHSLKTIKPAIYRKL